MTATTHHGSCHCGAVRYSVELDLTQPVNTCNCSMCGRAGTMLAFVPPDQFRLEQGEANLTSYKFNKQVIDHVFCKTCGIKPFARGKGPKGDTVAINVRCLEGVDVFALGASARQFDGKKL